MCERWSGSVIGFAADPDSPTPEGLASARETGRARSNSSVLFVSFVVTTRDAVVVSERDEQGGWVGGRPLITVIRSQLSGETFFGGTQQVLKHASYLLKKKEVFSRSYAQWIAIRSGNNSQLRRELRRMQAQTRHVPIQWSDSDFAPISEAMENVFRELGWLL